MGDTAVHKRDNSAVHKRPPNPKLWAVGTVLLHFCLLRTYHSQTRLAGQTPAQTPFPRLAVRATRNSGRLCQELGRGAQLLLRAASTVDGCGRNFWKTWVAAFNAWVRCGSSFAEQKSYSVFF